MKKLYMVFIAFTLCSTANSALVGKFDIDTANFEAISLREFHDGMWLVGAQKQIWELKDDTSGTEAFHVSAFWASRLEGNDTAYGPSIGMPLGTIGTVIVNGLSTISSIAPPLGSLTDAFTMPPWLKKIDSWMSVDFYGGYRPTISHDDHHFVYGVGGKIKVPLDQIYSWAKGSNGQKGL